MIHTNVKCHLLLLIKSLFKLLIGRYKEKFDLLFLINSQLKLVIDGPSQVKIPSPHFLIVIKKTHPSNVYIHGLLFINLFLFYKHGWNTVSRGVKQFIKE